MGVVNRVEWKGPAIIVGGLLAVCAAIALLTDTSDPWKNVLAEDGSYGVRYNVHNPLDRCMFPVLVSYEWTLEAEQVTGIEVCE